MADNYLEKKYEDFQKGRSVIRKVNPSLDSLLSTVGAKTGRNDSTYKVKNAQLEAAIKSAGRLCEDFEASCDESTGTISLKCTDEYTLGRILLAVELKLAELKLQSSIKKKGTGPIGCASALIYVFK